MAGLLAVFAQVEREILRERRDLNRNGGKRLGRPPSVVHRSKPSSYIGKQSANPQSPGLRLRSPLARLLLRGDKHSMSVCVDMHGRAARGEELTDLCDFFGRGGGIRTRDPLRPSCQNMVINGVHRCPQVLVD